MSDTPETDAQIFDACDGQGCEAVLAGFARKLERERDEARNCFKVAMETAETYKRERDQWREIARIAVAARDHNRAMWDKCAAELGEILKSDK